MNGILTLQSLRELWRKRMEGQDLPLDWCELAEAYLKRKRWGIKHLGGRNWDIAQLREAEMIVRGLYAY